MIRPAGPPGGEGGLAGVGLHPEARAELREAAARYDERVPGLGIAFLDAVERAMRVAAEAPQLGAPLAAGLRRLLVQRFPFAVIDRQGADGVEVVAVAHVRRRPGCWSEGTTETEALANIQDAIAEYLAARDALLRGAEVHAVEVVP